MKQTYIVTGANGHLGNTIVKQLVADGKNVRALILKNDNLPALKDADVQKYYGDVCDIASLEQLFERAADEELSVIHAAGIVSITAKHNKMVREVNVNGTKNIVELCLRKGVKRLVYVSSVHAIPEKKKGEAISEKDYYYSKDLDGEYAKTKTEATKAVLEGVEKGLNAVIVMPSGITGPLDYGTTHVTQLMLDYWNKRLTAGVSGGYDFVDVRDAAAGVIAAAEKGRKGEIYILSNRFVSVKEILDTLYEITGRHKIKTYLPLWFAKASAPLSEVYYWLRRVRPLYTRYSLDVLKSNAAFDNSKAKTELGFKNRDFRETINDQVEWLIENKRVGEKNERGARKRLRSNAL